MLNCGQRASNRPTEDRLCDNSTWDFSAQAYRPINFAPFEASVPLSHLKIKLESERRVWAGILKVVSLGLLVLTIAELLSALLLPAREGKWVLWVVCAVVSGFTVIAAGLGMRAAWRMTSVSARCYLHYLIAYSGIFIISVVLISMLIINSEVFCIDSPAIAPRDEEPAAFLAARLMLGMMVLVLASVCMCSLLVYCALALFKSSEACESIDQLPERTEEDQDRRETIG